jgi:hypothetical protein
VRRDAFRPVRADGGGVFPKGRRGVVRRADPAPPPDGGDRDEQGNPEVDQGVGGALPPYPADDSVLNVRKLPKPVGAYQAPEAVRPGEPPGKSELLQLARETREQTAASFAILATVDPRAAHFPNSAQGKFLRSPHGL